MQCNGIFKLLKKILPNNSGKQKSVVGSLQHLSESDYTGISEFDDLPKYGDTVITADNIDKYIDYGSLQYLNVINSAMGLFNCNILCRIKDDVPYSIDGSDIPTKKVMYTHIYEQYRMAVHLLRVIPYQSTSGKKTIDILQLHKITSDDNLFFKYTKHCFEYMLECLEADVGAVMDSAINDTHDSMNIIQRQAVRNKYVNLFDDIQDLKSKLSGIIKEIDTGLNRCDRKLNDWYIGSHGCSSMLGRYNAIWGFIAIIYLTYMKNGRIRLNKRLDTIKTILLSSKYETNVDRGFHLCSIVAERLHAFYTTHHDVIFDVSSESTDNNVN